MVGYVLFRTVLEYGMLWKRVVWCEDALYRLAEATRQAELCSVYNLPLSEFAKKQLRSKLRQRWDMDYSVGGPLWLEWQRLQTHSEWEKWSGIYTNAQKKQPAIRFKVYYDWLLENGFELEAKEIADTIAHKIDWICYPSFVSVQKSSDSEPVEGAA